MLKALASLEQRPGLLSPRNQHAVQPATKPKKNGERGSVRRPEFRKLRCESEVPELPFQIELVGGYPRLDILNTTV